MQITAEQLRRFCPSATAAIVKGIVENQRMLEHAEITTPLRLCHFMAQIAVESDHLKVTREYASGAAYEGRRDLGNTQPGDGRRYRGRGLIQTTGRANYAEARECIDALGLEAPDFELDPEAMEEFPWALLGGIVYWRKRNINQHADRDDVLAVTKAVNGGTNGLTERTAYLAKAKTIWPSDIALKPPREPSVKLDKAVASFIRATKRLQKELAAAGYEPGAVDGDFGKATATALKAYRADHTTPASTP